VSIGFNGELMTVPSAYKSTLIITGLLAGYLFIAPPGAKTQSSEVRQSSSGSSPARPNGNADRQSTAGPYAYSASPSDYYGWIERIGSEDEAIRRAISEGDEKVPAPDRLTKHMHISETEEQPLRNIALIAYEQLHAVEVNYRTEVQGCPRDCSPEKKARLDDLMKRRADILGEAEAQVRRELNDTDYAKFSDYICHRCVENQRIIDESVPKPQTNPPQEQR
jgi:hypothetical protein